MKRALAVCSCPLIAATSTQVVADSGAGCGIGQQIFAGQSGRVPHLLAASTNGTSFNQSSGLTFDSLGCNGETTITAFYQRNFFVANNFDNIARDAAQGGGQHLQSLAALMQMNEEDSELFYQFSQQQYDALFGQQVDNHEEWLIQFDAALLNHPELSQYAMARA